MTPEESGKRIEELLEGEISEADFLRLEAEMIVSEEARQAYYERQKLHTGLQIEAEAAQGRGAVDAPASSAGGVRGRRKFDWLTGTSIAALVLFVGILGWQMGQDTKRGARGAGEEPVATGFGVIAAQSDAVWSGRRNLEKGDLLPGGRLTLGAGVAQLELFSGVMLVFEGEAEFEVISSMEVALIRGKVRAQVPEPARGFEIRIVPGGVIGRGTDFAVEATSNHLDLHGLAGSTAWQPDSGRSREVKPGESMRWDLGTGREATSVTFDRNALLRLGAVEKAFTDQRADRLRGWQEHSRRLRTDPRLLAYFPMDQEGDWGRQLIDESLSPGGNGTIVRADRAMDRWGRPYGGLDFSPMGSRVRLNVPGDHRSLTLMCWVKIDSLDRWYNSLFLTDGHELHEPHWQIMDDGRLFFSVKAREATRKDADKHIAFSPPIWTPAQGGQWMHIATVYDGDAATTTHYVNGEAVSIDQIPEDMRVERARIGAASIGNWSEPKRDDPDFAVRNLNGTIDEFALFAAPLTAAEIREIYEAGRP